MDNTKKTNLFIITGLSGSGKSSALDFFEDQDFFTVDNIPMPLIPELMQLLDSNVNTKDKDIAVVVDVRSAISATEFRQILKKLNTQFPNSQLKLIFLEASKEVIMKRFNLTKRRHPLGFMRSLLEAIETEKKQMKPIKSMADKIIDTSMLNSNQLKRELTSFLGTGPLGVEVLLTSFGFKHGVPTDADYVLDVRFLPNPYYVPELKKLTGKDEAVRRYIFEKGPMTDQFLRQCIELLETVISYYTLSGKNYIHIAIGCTGGCHRSVFVAEWLAERIGRIKGVESTITHRDMLKDAPQ